MGGPVGDSPPQFFFGAMSPYSWFAAERIEELLPAAEWRPVFVGGLFQACGKTAWGLTEQRPLRIADCELRARRRGLGPIRWPEPWPTSDLLIARAMVHATGRGLLKPFALAAMRAAFLAGRDLGELAAVQAVGAELGIGSAELADACSDPAIKAGLRQQTERAVELGVSGVPTIALGERLFWGDDRLEEAASALRAGSGSPPRSRG